LKNSLGHIFALAAHVTVGYLKNRLKIATENLFATSNTILFAGENPLIEKRIIMENYDLDRNRI